MKAVDFEIKYTPVEICDKALPVIIVAAGSSTRMMGAAKQFIEICGTPVIARTMLAFERSKRISSIILVTKDEYIADMQRIAEKYSISKLKDIVSGGNSRQESVKNGLNRLDADESKVLIHDGARPLVSQKIIDNVCEGLMCHDAVVCGVKVKDTIKIVGDTGDIVSTLPRETLVSVQTPQGVDVVKYRELLSKSDLSNFTDDASIMENGGYSVFVVDGDYNNIKITTPEDILLADFIIESSEDML